MNMPDIVYLQTTTECNGHCRYCPHDDIYADKRPRKMSNYVFLAIIRWLMDNKYSGRIGLLLHGEPSLDPDLQMRVDSIRQNLPGVKIETATNGIIDQPIFKQFDVVDLVPAGSRTETTSRAGNVRACPEIESRKQLVKPPCKVPGETMPIAANGDVLLCCQDWRHEAVVGTVKDLTAARENQLRLAEQAKKLELEICRDCMAGKTAEEVGERLGQRTI